VQYVVSAIEVFCFFNRRDVGRFLYHTYNPLVASRATAVNARIDVGNVVADGAEAKAGFHITHGRGQAFRVSIAGTQNVEGKALSALAPDSRKFFQFVNEPGHWLGKFRHFPALLLHGIFDSKINLTNRT
jgi:hypothetical protein